ncbi:MAG: hypothetical protein OHK0023_03480 [Anaerolineae bacterium]
MPVKRIFDVDLTADVRALMAMTAALTPYIYDSEIFGTLNDNSLPRLTIGGILMRLHRLKHLSGTLTAAQKSALESAASKFAEVRQQWIVHYERKISREILSRIGSLDQFANECAQNLAVCADNYPAAMEKRVMIEHLRDELEALNLLSTEITGRLAALDNALNRCLEAGEFCWSPHVQAAYPKEKFWFLYQAVRKPVQK